MFSSPVLSTIVLCLLLLCFLSPLPSFFFFYFFHTFPFTFTFCDPGYSFSTFPFSANFPLYPSIGISHTSLTSVTQTHINYYSETAPLTKLWHNYLESWPPIFLIELLIAVVCILAVHIWFRFFLVVKIYKWMRRCSPSFDLTATGLLFLQGPVEAKGWAKRSPLTQTVSEFMSTHLLSVNAAPTFGREVNVRAKYLVRRLCRTVKSQI